MVQANQNSVRVKPMFQRDVYIYIMMFHLESRGQKVVAWYLDITSPPQNNSWHNSEASVLPYLQFALFHFFIRCPEPLKFKIFSTVHTPSAIHKICTNTVHPFNTFSTPAALDLFFRNNNNGATHAPDSWANQIIASLWMKASKSTKGCVDPICNLQSRVSIPSCWDIHFAECSTNRGIANCQTFTDY